MVSPLISLMQDQVKSVMERGITAVYAGEALQEGSPNDTEATIFGARRVLLITVWRVTCAVNYIPMCHEILPIFARRIKRPFIRLGTRLPQTQTHVTQQRVDY